MQNVRLDDERKSVEQAVTHILKMQFAHNNPCDAPDSYLDREGIFCIWTGRAYFQQETLIDQPCHIDSDQSSEKVNTQESDLERF